MKSIENRKARHTYFILETYEAGIALKGSEVKSLRSGKADLRDSYCVIEDGEVFAVGMYIAPYEDAMNAIPPRRKRKLLLNKREIKRLYGKVQEKGFTLIPLSLYFNENGIVKVKIALCKRRAKYEKRERIKERDMQKEARRALGKIERRLTQIHTDK
ncbi:MAG: SsrA-binding protein SmpB [bacterium]|nr:SsrA-binding protein SmpB [bacterium]